MASSHVDHPHEVHVTVDLNGRDSEALAMFARDRDLRFLHVLLDAGVHPSQPMLSWHQSGGVDEALTRSARLAEELERFGMVLSRIKIEVDLGSVTADRPRYYEAHFKVELSEARTAELAELARELGVHMSKSALWQAEGASRRFLTARGDERRAALSLFDQVEQALRDRGWDVVAARREAVLHDSNVSLDTGWSV